MKKTLAAILAFILVLCLFSVPVMAEGEDTYEDLSQLSLEELQALYEAVQNELLNRTGDKEPISVVSCSSKKEYGYYDAYFTIKNNLDVPINTVTLTLIFTDKDGNNVYSTYPQEPQRLMPGKTQVIDGSCPADLSPVGVYVDEISYYLGEDDHHSFFVNNPETFPIGKKKK